MKSFSLHKAAIFWFPAIILLTIQLQYLLIKKLSWSFSKIVQLLGNTMLQFEKPTETSLVNQYKGYLHLNWHCVFELANKFIHHFITPFMMGPHMQNWINNIAWNQPWKFFIFGLYSLRMCMSLMISFQQFFASYLSDMKQRIRTEKFKSW